MKPLDSLCKAVQQIAREAGEFLKEERKKFDHSKVEEKSAHNYVSYVDKESEQRLVAALSALLPEAGFLTEEETILNADKEYTWIIDPLDGTTNYIHDMAPYCVSIALRDREELLLGVVYEICRDECFWAVKGGESYLNGEVIRVSDCKELKNAFVALGFPYRSDVYKPTALQLVDRLYGHSGGCRLLGSAAIELCYVACGRFDARVEAYLGAWDIAAGALILQQAGGKITDFAGGNNWTSGREVIATNNYLHEVILRLMS